MSFSQKLHFNQLTSLLENIETSRPNKKQELLNKFFKELSKFNEDFRSKNKDESELVSITL